MSHTGQCGAASRGSVVQRYQLTKVIMKDTQKQ